MGGRSIGDLWGPGPTLGLLQGFMGGGWVD